MTRRHAWWTPSPCSVNPSRFTSRALRTRCPRASCSRMATGRRPSDRAEPTFVGRDWELSALNGGPPAIGSTADGSVVGLVGPPGIGKSRIVRELTALAKDAGAEVFAAYSESHTTDLPFHAAGELLRDFCGAAGLDAEEARGASARTVFGCRQ